MWWRGALHPSHGKQSSTVADKHHDHFSVEYPDVVSDPSIVTPTNAVPLTSHDVVREAVPKSPGIYAAWVLDDEALRAAGIDGPAPRCVYVGKAEQTGLAA